EEALAWMPPARTTRPQSDAAREPAKAAPRNADTFVNPTTPDGPPLENMRRYGHYRHVPRIAIVRYWASRAAWTLAAGLVTPEVLPGERNETQPDASPALPAQIKVRREQRPPVEKATAIGERNAFAVNDLGLPPSRQHLTPPPDESKVLLNISSPGRVAIALR